MNYFVDIECNQYTDDIISIAFEREDYVSFSTLIKPSTKVTKFITNLTGITNEEAKNAPSIGKALKEVKKWLDDFQDNDTFYFYGCFDEIVLKKTLNKITNPIGEEIIKYILNHLVDYSLVVQRHFGLVKPVSLIKVVEYYKNEKVIQTHSALEDARFLHYIYTCVEQETDVDKDVFIDYKTTDPVSTNTIKCVDENNEVINSFESMSDALTWLINDVRQNNRTKLDRQSTRARLAQAIKFQTKYYGYYWQKE